MFWFEMPTGQYHSFLTKFNQRINTCTWRLCLSLVFHIFFLNNLPCLYFTCTLYMYLFKGSLNVFWLVCSLREVVDFLWVLECLWRKRLNWGWWILKKLSKIKIFKIMIKKLKFQVENNFIFRRSWSFAINLTCSSMVAD